MRWGAAWIWMVRWGRGLHESSDCPAGLALDPTADSEGRERDAQVDLGRVALAVVDRPGVQAMSGYPERLLDLEEPAVGADHELGCDWGFRRGRRRGW